MNVHICPPFPLFEKGKEGNGVWTAYRAALQPLSPPFPSLGNGEKARAYLANGLLAECRKWPRPPSPPLDRRGHVDRKNTAKSSVIPCPPSSPEIMQEFEFVEIAGQLWFVCPLSFFFLFFFVGAGRGHRGSRYFTCPRSGTLPPLLFSPPCP